MKRKEYVQSRIFETITDLHKDGYYLLNNPLCFGYQAVETWYAYETIYRKKNVFVIELPSRFNYILNRNKSNKYHCKLIFTK